MMLRSRARRWLGALLAMALAAPVAAAAPAALHVPSPDWRDQIVYFVLTDRFANGDPSNDDQGAGEFDPGSNKRYNGGDLRGLLERLDYIQGLGATAVWITPPVANLWLDPQVDYAGYHGYWAENFRRVDRHLGALDDYRRLSRALHGRGMYLVQDIVVNHTGNFFAYRGGWDADDPARFYVPNTTARPVTRPSQPPFDRNDPRDPAQRRAAIYHWTPDVSDYNDPVQEKTWQMSGLDDLNTDNPVVRRALRASYGFWLREVGVDAMRVDTAFYVPPDYFANLLDARDPRAPGLRRVARATGRRDFLVFGEGFGIDRPFDDTQARRIDRYVRAPDGRPRLSGMLDFPLYGAFGDVFARGRPTAELAHRLRAAATVYADPHRMATFVDNHDVDRFLAGGSEAGLRQALLAMMTLPGIPVVYYGTEQGFTQPRAAMFAAGFGSGGRDHYDTAAPLYRCIAGLAALRRAHRALSRATPVVLHENAAGPGAIAWRMSDGGESLLVVLNTAERETLLDNLDLGAGVALEGLYGLDGRPADVAAGAGGRISLRLAARSGAVYRLRPGGAPATAAAAPTLDALPATVDGDVTLGGRAAGALRLVVDGDLAAAQRVVPAPDGRWQATLDTGAMTDPAVAHRVVAWSEADGGASPGAVFRVERAWTKLAELDDPAGDDAGPEGRYRYPADPSDGARHTMDLRHVAVFGAGGALRIDLAMAALTQSWNPPNGFDHVAFTIFVELPGADGGARVMPGQNGELPDGLRWHRRLRVHGWSNALFGPEGASATAEGRPITPGAAVTVDRARGTVSLVLPAAALGAPASTHGLKLYVTTWDYDGGYRALTPAPGAGSLGGGDDARDRKVMDDTAVITLP